MTRNAANQKDFNIVVSHELWAQMKARPDVSWSAVARDAFRVYLLTHPTPAPGAVRRRNKIAP